MPLILDVVTALDDRSALATSRQLERQFEESGHDAGEKFGTNLAAGVAAGFRSGDFESLTGVLASSGIAARAATSGTAIGAAFAGGLVVAASAALVDLGVKVAETFENINRDITLHTAAAGQALDDLKAHADALVGSLDTTGKAVGDDMGVLSTVLQTQAGAALDQLTRHVEELRDRFGALDTRALAGDFVLFGVNAGQADNALASLTLSSRSTGAQLNDIITTLSASGSTLADAGLNIQQSGRFIGEVQQTIEGGASRALNGLEAAMKAATAAGQDLGTYLNNVAASIDYYRDTNNKAAADAVAYDAFGTRNWAQAETIIKDYFSVVQAGPDAYASNGAAIDAVVQATKNLGNSWTEVKNKLEAPLASGGLGFTDELAAKLDNVGKWIDAHRDDLRNAFSGALTVITDVAEAIGSTATFLGRHTELVWLGVTAWGVFKAIGIAATVADMYTSFAALSTATATSSAAADVATASVGGLDTAIGAEAVTADAATGQLGLFSDAELAAGTAAVTAGGEVAGIGVAATGAAAAAATASRGIIGSLVAITTSSAFVAVSAFAATFAALEGISLAFGDYSGQEPSTQKYDSDGNPIGPLAPINAGPAAPAAPATPVPGADDGSNPYAQLDPLNPNAPGGPPAPPPGLIVPGGPKEPKLPPAPEVPFPAGYGAAPTQGETEEQYSQQQRVLEAQHTIAEARARLNQLEGDNNATADDLQKARNELLKAQGEEYKAELEQTKAHSRAMGTLGATIDKDFGLSKGLPGIADNITKFIANLTMAPVLGALNQIVQANGTSGGAGLLGIAALNAGIGTGPAGAPGSDPVLSALGLSPKGIYGPGANADGSAAPESAAGGGGGGGTGIFQGLSGYGPGANQASGGSAPGAAASGYSGPQPVGAGAERWAPLVSQVVAQQSAQYPGINQQAWTQALLTQINTESGGDPNSVNPNDTDGRGGTQRVAGILNFLQSTFQAHDVTGGAYMDPSSQIAAAMSLVAGGHGLGPGGGVPQYGGTIGVPGKGFYAAGGDVSGGPSGTDTVNAWLTPGEEVLSTDDVAAMGGTGAVEGYRQSLHRQVGGPVPPAPSPPPGPALGSAWTDYWKQNPAAGATAAGDAPAGIPPEAPHAPTVGAPALTAPSPPTGPAGPEGQQGPTAIGGADPSVGYGKGIGGSGGGLAGGAAGAVPGLGIAAQTVEQEIQRGIQYGGELAGIGVEALQQTFLPTGGSKLAQNSWLTKIAGGIAGASPQLPNVAGKPATPPGPDAPQGVPAGVVPTNAPTPSSVTREAQTGPAPGGPERHAEGGPVGGGPQVQIDYHHHGGTEDAAGQNIARHVEASYTGTNSALTGRR